jgi:serine/threonine protein phosphatase PrpC
VRQGPTNAWKSVRTRVRRGGKAAGRMLGTAAGGLWTATRWAGGVLASAGLGVWSGVRWVAHGLAAGARGVGTGLAWVWHGADRLRHAVVTATKLNLPLRSYPKALLSTGSALLSGWMAGMLTTSAVGGWTDPRWWLLSAGATGFVRAVWTPKQIRAPTSTALSKARASGAVTRIATALGIGFGIGAITLWLTQPPELTTLLAATIGSGASAFRTVLRRQLRGGKDISPRRTAWRAALLAVSVSGGYKLIGLLVPHSASPLVLGLVSAGAVLASIISSGVQNKDLGLSELAKAVIAGPLAFGVAWFTPILDQHLSGGLGTWWAAVLGSAIAVSANTPIADYSVAWGGRRLAEHTSDRPKATTPSTRLKDLIRYLRAQRFRYDAENISTVDNRILPWKAANPVLGGLASAMISHAWFGWPTTLPHVLAQAGVVTVGVWASGRIRDWLEHRRNYDGGQSPRVMRNPKRASLASGPRSWHHTRAYRRALRTLLDELAVPYSGRHPELTTELAGQVATALVQVLTNPVPEPETWWSELAGAGVVDPGVLAEYRAAEAVRREQHRRIVAVAVQVLASDPALVDAPLGLLVEGGRFATTELLGFTKTVLNQLLTEPELRALAGTPDTTWPALLADLTAERNAGRAEFLAGPRTALLNSIIAYYSEHDPGNENLVRAYLARRMVQREQHREDTRKVPTEPLPVLIELFDQRRRSARDNDQTQLEGAMGLLQATAELTEELRLSWFGRIQAQVPWDIGINSAIDAAPGDQISSPVSQGTALQVLLLIAGRPNPVTARGLATQFGGTAEDWTPTLRALHAMGALVTDGDGYRATEELRTLWRAAEPKLRRALRTDPAPLPGGAALAPLTGDTLSPHSPPARAAYPALRRLLEDGAMARRHWRDGWVDDAGIAGWWLRGLGYRARHPASRIDWEPEHSGPGQLARAGRWLRTELGASRRRGSVPVSRQRALHASARAVLRADRAYLRLRLAAIDARLRDGSGPPDAWLRALSPLQGAQAERVRAYLDLAGTADDALAALKDVDAHAYQVERTLRRARRILGDAPGADQAPSSPTAMLRKAITDLRAEHRRLDAAEDPLARADAEADAKRALEREHQAQAYARSAALDRGQGGFWLMLQASQAADALSLAYPTLALVDATPGTMHANQVRGAASRTVRGRGNQENQDAVGLAELPNGVAAALADGLGNATGSRQAAHAAVRAAIRYLRTTAGGNPQANAQTAFRDAVRQLMNDAADTDAAVTLDALPATTLLVAQLISTPGRPVEVTLGWVGDTRAYLLPSTGTGARELTTDHTYTGELGTQLTRWLAADHTPEPQLHTEQVEPGLLVLATDGGWSHLGSPDTMAELLIPGAYHDPALAAEELTRAAQAGGAGDDITITVISIPPSS